ncbi:nitroreductase/quinone reductase family protein [Actinotalea solisilvae]|uniref:nitroreductase/quinone reductase family protein n=1 Tax=Actinotalea solisilvae TaxID=2072922 RepID=UPI0018F1BEC2|nr:nitroreductase/quinone reductase family protein [Actinotalea solisilvae]
MDPSQRPAVEAAHPPKRAYVVVNRVMRWLLSSPRRASRIGRALLLLHVTGRQSGRALTFPVAYRREDDGRLLVLTSSRWRHNLRGRPDVEVTLLGVRRPARAELVEDPDTVARVYRALIEAERHRRAGRRMGIRLTVDRVPTLEELADAAVRDGLAVVRLDVTAAP